MLAFGSMAPFGRTSCLATTNTFLILLSISYFCAILPSFFWDVSDPISDTTFIRKKLQLVFIPYSDRICLRILRDDEKCGSSSDLDTFTLSDRVRESSLMFTYDSSTGIEDISWLFRESAFEEFFHTDLADEAESLAIFSFCIWESCFLCDLSDFRLKKMSDREYCF
jgi:hypothetical protein